DKITTNTVDNLGYGYLGISAKSVNVGGELGSDASKNLRKAFATVFALYRDVTVDSYYGEAASVINYPISNTSWAAPQATDSDYAIAFSKDVDGNEIYTSDMDDAAKQEAALNAALGYFEAAGYTVKDGKLTDAPEGAKMQYEVWIPADGSGDHPSFMMLNLASDAFKKIGMDLVVKDLANSADLWTGIEADQVPMWCAAWGASPDPDMYQIYYSGVESGKDPGGSNYMYDIADPELDDLIMEARTSMDQAFRKQLYKACLDIIVDWAVEVPVYQRQNAIIFSTERVNLDTVTPDITTYYGWLQEIEKLEPAATE
ncbi:MAG: ABC transporter substrate-binding protein, partial [Firmicutes bacterium]|nr:ABC transporter substrate-binding protein [Bacillota bacterium]